MFRLVVAGLLNRSDIFALALCLCLLPVLRSGLQKKKSMEMVLNYFFGDEQGSVGEQVRPRRPQENYQPCSLAGVAGVASATALSNTLAPQQYTVVNPAMTKIDEETQSS